MAEVTPPPLTSDERAELERLRGEVATLRTAEPPARRQIRWRSVFAIVLLVLGCVLVPVSLVAVWTHQQVSNTDSFVQTVSPLASDPAVQAAVTDRVTTTVFQYVDVPGLANEAINELAAQGLKPEIAQRLHSLTPALVSAVTGFVHTQVGNMVASPQFASLFDQSVRLAHQQAVTVLSGSSEGVVIKNGTVYLDLAPFIDAAKARLSAAGLTAVNSIPDVHPTIALAPADQLVRAQSAYAALNTLATVLPWITLLLLAAGVYLARNRFRALVAAGLGSALALVVLAAGLLVARSILVSEVPPTAAVAAADSFDIIVRFLRDSGRALLVLGLVVALGAFLAGGSDTAIGIRRWAADLLERGRTARTRSGPVGLWVGAHIRALRVAAVVLAALVFVFLDRPTGVAIVLIAAALLIVLALIEYLGGRPEAAAPQS
ncbi:MAG TPA: hypothetical protein VIY28_19620 [Pseudonocardiaceae bacterium]